jgi:hypothetical protein
VGRALDALGNGTAAVFQVGRSGGLHSTILLGGPPDGPGGRLVPMIGGALR